MARSAMYPEGSTTMTVALPVPLKAGLQRMAGRQRQSVSQIVTVILEDYLRRRGELAQPEPVAEAV